MTWPVLTYRDRALLYNALRDVEEIAYRLSEYEKPEWKKIVADVVTANDGKVWLRTYEVPTHMNIIDALFAIRDLLKLVIEMDNEVKIMMALKHWAGGSEEEKVEGQV